MPRWVDGQVLLSLLELYEWKLRFTTMVNEYVARGRFPKGVTWGLNARIEIDQLVTDHAP
jgi:hypothetical protein